MIALVDFVVLSIVVFVLYFIAMLFFKIVILYVLVSLSCFHTECIAETLE